MKFSRRTDWPRTVNELTRTLEGLRAKGARILDLTESNPTRCGFAYPGADLLAPLADPANLVYAPDPRGLAGARAAVARYYAGQGIAVEPAHIFLTAGTSEAYGFILRLLAGPGEAVLVPKPGYPLFELLSGMNDAEAAPYSLIYEKGWRIDAAGFERALERAPRAVMAVSPNNPTGHYLSPRDLALLNAGAKRARAALVVDEVFHEFGFDEGARPASAAASRAVLTFTLGGISKLLGLPQMKVAWIVLSGPDGEVQEAARRLEFITDTYLSVAGPAQRALPYWLGLKDKITGEIRARVLKNRARLAGLLARAGGRAAELLKAEGGWYAVLRIQTAEDKFTELLLAREGVLVHPGFFYDFEGGDHLVLSLLPEPALFEEAAGRLLATLP
jgi:aspartate/methionine/tyrosine aminotransferase